MHQAPQQQTKQSAATVITDLKQQQKRIEDAISWTENITASILKMPKNIRYFNRSVITPDSRFVDIAFLMKVDDRKEEERIAVFTINCSYTDQEIKDSMNDPFKAHDALIAHRNQMILKAYGTRQFDVWQVEDQRIWREGERETIAWMNKQVRLWLSYWFNKDYNPVFESGQTGVTYLGQRPLPHN